MNADLRKKNNSLVPKSLNEVAHIAQFRSEIDGFYEDMHDFDPYDLGDIFMKLAAWSARVSEIRGLVSRLDSRSNTSFRTKELDPFLDEIDRQFRTYSRVQALRDSEYKMVGKL